MEELNNVLALQEQPEYSDEELEELEQLAQERQEEIEFEKEIEEYVIQEMLKEE